MLNREYTLEEALNYRLEEDYDLIDEGRKRNKVVIMLKHHEPLDRILLYPVQMKLLFFPLRKNMVFQLFHNAEQAGNDLCLFELLEGSI